MGLFRKKRHYDYDPYDDYDLDEYVERRSGYQKDYQDSYDDYDEYYDDEYYDDYADEEYYDEYYYDDEYYDDYDPYDFDDVDYERDREVRPKGRKKSKKNRRKTARSAVDYEIWDQYQYQRMGYDEEFYSDSYISGEERRGFGSWFKRFLTKLLIIALLLGGAFIAYKLYVRAPNTQVLGGILNFKGRKETEETGGEKIPDSEAPNREPANVRKGVYTFVIVGKDVEGGHTDTIIVGLFDTEKHKLNFASIPRDTLINSAWNIKKINYVYPASINQGKDGTANLLEAISQLLGYSVGSYAILDIRAAEQLVDAIGGVNFDVPCDMDWDAPDQEIPLHIHIKKGYQLLNGEQAINVLRFRYSNDGSNTYPRGDIDRIDVQQNLMKAILRQALSVKNIPNLNKILEIFEDNIETNLKASNIAFFAQELLKLKTEDINFMVMPGKPDGIIYGMSYVIPDIDEWFMMVNKYLNPFDRIIYKDNLDMLSHDGVDFVTTQGKIRGGKQSFLGFNGE